MSYPKITLHPKREFSVESFHPWIFSGAIKNIEGKVEDGEAVEVFSAANKYLGTGHYSSGSIAVKLFSFRRIEDEVLFWNQALRDADQLRAALGLVANPITTAYRLVNAEGDNLPGLVIDRYDKTAVIQYQSRGMYRSRELIVRALRELLGETLTDIVEKDTMTKAENEQAPAAETNSRECIISEHGLRFIVDLAQGQKTGFYLDQRKNRKLVQGYASDRTVLDAFSHSGAFAVYALSGGAKFVTCVDASKRSVELIPKNIALNFEATNYRTVVQDCFGYLENLNEEYDLIVLDPPAFAKHQKGLKRGITGYEIINYHAIRQIASGGILFTFSCSQLVSKEMFRQAVLAAGKKAGRKVAVIHELTQAPCHPVNLFHREGEYLKGLALYVK